MSQYPVQTPGHAMRTYSTSHIDWMSRGACQAEDPDLFFPIASSGPSTRQIMQAKAICGRCPVCPACLIYALDTHQHGIWGGTTDDERRTMHVQQRRDATRIAAALKANGGGWPEDYIRVAASIRPRRGKDYLRPGSASPDR